MMRTQTAPPVETRPRDRRYWTRLTLRAIGAGLTLIFLIGAIMIAPTVRRIVDFGTAISSASPFSTQTLFLNGVGRVNMVILGYGGGDYPGAFLTDSIQVVSYDPRGGPTVLISVPRDLWVSLPDGFAKINSAYAYGMAHGGTAVAGQMATSAISQALGIDLNYWVSVDFTGFDDLVNAIGGVDINVPTAFSASTPETGFFASFDAGPQHMDGTTALAFARARYCIPTSEASDFARARRQQLLISAIASKLHERSEWGQISHVMDVIQPDLATNVSLVDLGLVFAHAGFGDAHRISLDTAGLVTYGTSDDGQSIVVPVSGDWNEIHNYIERALSNG